MSTSLKSFLKTVIQIVNTNNSARSLKAISCQVLYWNHATSCFVFNRGSIELINNKFHGLSPPGGFVSPSGGFASLSFDQAVSKNSQRHLAIRMQSAFCINQIVPGFVVYYLNKATIDSRKGS